MTALHISDDLSLPVDAATQTFAILARKRAGKSNAAVVMAEEMYSAGIPWVAIDPKGDWWGMRSSADGDRPGLDIVVFGGRHGDIPLEPTSGVMMADLILARLLTCIIDVSEFSRADVIRFLTAFGDRLYRQATDDPLHLFLEEAHEYLPQRVMGDEARMVGVWQRIVKQGGFKGLGCTLVSQRSAVLNKDVLTQVDTLIVLQTTGPQDRAAVKAWVDTHDASPEMMHELPSLQPGEAWVWSPTFLEQLVRIKFRRRSTFDSGSTPKVGEKRRQPTKLADVNLDELRVLMAETIEKATADDPKALKRRIVDLERQLAAAAKTQAPVRVETVERVVEVERLPKRLLSELGKIHTQIGALLDQPATSRPTAAGPGPARVVPKPASSDLTPRRVGGLSKVESAFLNVLAQQRAGCSKVQLAILSGYSIKSSSFGNALGSLRTAGLVNRGEPIMATDAGIDAAGDVTPLPSGVELMNYWLARLGKAERVFLTTLVEMWPASSDRDELAFATGYSATSSSFGNTLGKLRSLELVDGWRANDDFARAVRGGS